MNRFHDIMNIHRIHDFIHDHMMWHVPRFTNSWMESLRVHKNCASQIIPTACTISEHEITVGHLTFPTTVGVDHDLYNSHFDLTMSEPNFNTIA